MTVEQLKALGYDQVKILNQTQANLQSIENVMAKKTQELQKKAKANNRNSQPAKTLPKTKVKSMRH